MEGIKYSRVALADFSVDECVKTPCMVTTYQKRYFITSNILDTQEQIRYVLNADTSVKQLLPCSYSVRSFAEKSIKGCKLRYNPYTQSIQEIGSSGQILDIANELRGDIYMVHQAMKNMKVSRVAR